MMASSSPSELTLDCKPHTYSMLLKSFGDINHHHYHHQQNDQTQKLEDFLSRLEEERLKIDAFKRELPLCMQLLTNAMEASRQQLQSYKANNNSDHLNHNGATTRPVLEEFIPLKINSGTEATDHQKSDVVTMAPDKANWMTSAQLWSQGSNERAIMQQKQQQNYPNKETHDDGDELIGFSMSPNNKQNNEMLGFSCPSPTLALASPENQEIVQDNSKKNLEVVSLGKGSDGNATIEQDKTGDGGDSGSNSGGCSLSPMQDSQPASGQTTTTPTQPHRKARRCWSPDLHRRFVNALQMLGGSQVATPKQIRELMKVDGLTNDEVKSHLQKYRLHTRRPGPTPQAAAAGAPQLVVVGGIWVPPEYATAAAHGGAQAAAAATIYGGAHHPTPHHHQNFSVGHDFYTSAATTPPLHHQFHVYKPPPSRSSPPESRVRPTGDRSESIEDGGKSSESGGESKGLVLRDDNGEVSNGSDITLKF